VEPVRAVLFIVILAILVISGYVASLTATAGNLVVGFVSKTLSITVDSLVPDPYNTFSAVVGAIGVLIVVASVAYMVTRIRREEEVG
jgi:FtsH-binding integral membrane protein